MARCSRSRLLDHLLCSSSVGRRCWYLWWRPHIDGDWAQQRGSMALETQRQRRKEVEIYG